MANKYSELLDIANKLSPQQRKPDGYYIDLIANTEEILLDIAMRNQNRVAKDLALTSVKFSHLLPLLKELYDD